MNKRTLFVVLVVISMFFLLSESGWRKNGKKRGGQKDRMGKNGKRHRQSYEDPKCLTVKCSKGFRCQNGVCIPRRWKAKRHICNSNKDLKPIRCNKKNYQIHQNLAMSTCGLTRKGDRFDFQNDYSPCQNKRIAFFYRVPCSQAPQVCQKGEECLNGKCVSLFKEEKYCNQQECSSSKQCEKHEICVAGKCIDRKYLFKYMYSHKKK